MALARETSKSAELRAELIRVHDRACQNLLLSHLRSGLRDVVETNLTVFLLSRAKNSGSAQQEAGLVGVRVVVFGLSLTRLFSRHTFAWETI